MPAPTGLADEGTADRLAPEDRILLQAALEAAAGSWSPYSRFRVGAAVRTADGSIYRGANMENASYGLSLCAEVQALMGASFAGGSPVEAIAVTGFSADASPGEIDGQPPITMPCGRCRQLIHEAAVRGGRDVMVIAADASLGWVRAMPISALLPAAFGPDDLSRG